MSEPVAAFYKKTIINGHGMYETIDLPGDQFNLSVADILSQIYLPVKNPGPYKGIMVDNQVIKLKKSVYILICIYLSYT